MLLLPPVTAQGKVWVVSPVPAAGDFTTISAALTAASAGDLLLVKGGTYGEALTIDHPISIQAEVGQSVTIVNRLVVSNLIGGTVHLRGLELTGALWLQDNTGLVWIEGSRITDGPLADNPVLVQNCNDVVLVGTEVVAEETYDFGYVPPFAASALSAGIGSAIQAYDCSFKGADGIAYDCGEMDDCVQVGGPGISLGSTDFLFLSGCTVVGGNGVYDNGGFRADCSPGGVGLCGNGSSVVLDSVLRGGSGGASTGGTPCAPPGPDYTGSVSFLPDRALRFSASSPEREGGAATLTFDGPPLTPIYLTSGPVPIGVYLPVASGVLLVGAPRELEYVGLTDEAGRLSVLLPRGLLPTGIESQDTFLQAGYIHLTPTAPPPGSAKRRQFPMDFVLGSGSMLVTLDGSF
jgi:hypothetical protein